MSPARKPKEIVPVSIKPEDGKWYATSKYRPLLQGSGSSYMEALDDLKDGLYDDINYNETMTSRIDGVNATIEIYAAENRSLDEFGGIEFEAPECVVATPVEDEQLAIEAQEIPQLPAAEFDRETCEFMTIEGAGDGDEEVKVCELLRAYSNEHIAECCASIGDKKCHYLRETRPRCETCTTICEHAGEDDVACVGYEIRSEREEKGSSAWDTLPKLYSAKKEGVFGVSLHKDMVKHFSALGGTWFIFPQGGGQSKISGVKTGDRVLVYETAAQKGRKAYVGEFRMGDIQEVPKDEICSPEWVARLQLSPDIISDAVGNRFSDIRVGKVEDYVVYDNPKMTKRILEDKQVPKGLMYLTESYVNDLFEGVDI